MLYRALANHNLRLAPKESCDFDAGDGVVVIPEPNSKVYAHWFTETGKLRKTYTIISDTEIRERVTLINGLDAPTTLHIVKVA